MQCMHRTAFNNKKQMFLPKECARSCMSATSHTRRQRVERDTQTSVKSIDMLVVNAYGACLAVQSEDNCFNMTEENQAWRP